MCNRGGGDDGSQGCLLISYISWCRDKTLYLLLPRTLRDPPVQDTIDSPETTYRSGSNARRPRSHTPPGCILACMGSSCFMHPSLGYCLLARRLRGGVSFPVQGWRAGLAWVGFTMYKRFSVYSISFFISLAVLARRQFTISGLLFYRNKICKCAVNGCGFQVVTLYRVRRCSSTRVYIYIYNEQCSPITPYSINIRQFHYSTLPRVSS